MNQTLTELDIDELEADELELLEGTVEDDTEVVTIDYTNQINIIIVALGVLAGMMWVRNIWK